MFNVLPEILKNNIRLEYKIRRIVVFLLLILLMQLIFLVALLPSWVLSFYKQKEVSGLINEGQKSVLIQDVNTTLQIIDSTNKRLSALNNVMEYPEVLPIFMNIISNKSSGIRIKEFSYNSSTTTASVAIRGVSSTRESLVSFVKKLNDSKSFVSIDSPVSNLAKQKNIDFIISLKVIN